MERITAEIVAQRGSGRAYVRVEGDVRTRPRPVGVASQHRVYAALPEFCNFEMRKTRRLSFNAVYAVELEPEVTPEGKRWSVTQTLAFLSATEADPLYLLFRIVLLGGVRRGEAVGLRWSDVELDLGVAEVRHTLVTVGNAVAEGTPKTKAGKRIYGLDPKTVKLLKEHRKAQLKARLKAGESWQDNDLVFCKEDGTAYKPDAVTRCFKRLAALAGLPVIKLHEGRHTNASLQHDAQIDPEIRRRSLGNVDAAMTSHYIHIEAEKFRQAAEAVAKLVEGSGS
jgi:integrase